MHRSFAEGALRGSLVLFAAFAGLGCFGTTIQPGHVGLLFQPRGTGLQHEVLGPGYHSLGLHDRIEEFDITYSTHKEEVHSTSQEGLAMDLNLAIIYRPVIAELYQLDTEIGPNYYDEVVGPEFRSAARGVFARHSYLELQAKNEKIEDEIEADLRRRIRGKHVEISSITLEAIHYAPEIAAAVRAKLVGEQEAARQKAALENEALRKKLEIANDAEQAKLRADAAIRDKKNERAIAEEDAAVEKLKAETEASTRVTLAKAESEERQLIAKAKKAEATSISEMEVMIHAYDALSKLGGTGTTIWLGDWSRVPNFLFPKSAFPGVGGTGVPAK